MGHLVRLVPGSTRTRNSLLALSMFLIGVVPVCGQQPGSTPGSAATASPVTATPSPGANAVPSATVPPTPSEAATNTASPSNQATTGSPAPDTNTAQTDRSGTLEFGNFKFSGPIWFVLVALIVVLVVTVVLPGRLIKQVNDKWSSSARNWIIILVIGIALFFLIGLFLGVRRSEPVTGSALPPSTPTPTPSIEPSPLPTISPPPSPSPSPAVAPSSVSSPPVAPTSPTSPATVNQTATPVPTPFELSVSEVNVVGDEVAGLGDNIILTIKNLKQELARPLAANTDRIDARKHVLFLDDMEVKKLYPVAFDSNRGALTFKLTRTPESKDVWTNLLAAQKNPTRSTKVSIGLEGKPPLPSDQTFTLGIYERGWLNLGVFGFLLVVGIFLWLASKTSIIRDSGPPEPPQGSFRPYSLGRAQVAWWFFIILGSFFFIALVTQDFDTITTSSLVLLGIGTGTALGAAMVDANKRESTKSTLLTFKPQQAKLVEMVAQLKARVTELEAKRDAQNNVLTDSDLSILNTTKQELATKEAELVEVNRQVGDAASALNSPVSEGFVKDILSDVNGVTFHRFQMVVWTIVLGVIFGWSVWKRLSMPEFSETLLALMGISAGTYIGFKFPERQTAPGPQQPTPSSQPATKSQQPAPI